MFRGRYFLVFLLAILSVVRGQTCNADSSSCFDGCVLIPVVECVSDAGEGYEITFNYFSNCTTTVIISGQTTDNAFVKYNGNLVTANDAVGNSPFTERVEFPPGSIDESTRINVTINTKDEFVVWYLGRFSVTGRWAGVDTCVGGESNLTDVVYNPENINTFFGCEVSENGYLRNIAVGFGAVAQLRRNVTTNTASPCVSNWSRYKVGAATASGIFDVCIVNEFSDFVDVPALVCQAIIESTSPECCTFTCSNANCTSQAEQQFEFVCDENDQASFDYAKLIGKCITDTFRTNQRCNDTIYQCLFSFASVLARTQDGIDLYSCLIVDDAWNQPYCGMNDCYTRTCNNTLTVIDSQPVAVDNPSNGPVTSPSGKTSVASVTFASVFIVVLGTLAL